ncbi:MAG TPA: KTSC domain-containing protein [Solirubrobacteraceae bacterium]|jgi:lysyl-tRNA synthetase class 2
MQAVDSSAVAAVGYDRVAEELYVEFVDGDRYAYTPVPNVIWRALLEADSKGRFVNKVLKPHFRVRRV